MRTRQKSIIFTEEVKKGMLVETREEVIGASDSNRTTQELNFSVTVTR